jgi:hypothetical protein
LKKIIKETTRLLLQGIITKEEADKILIDLHFVNQQREQLLAYHKHLNSFNDPTIYNATEAMIDEYLTVITPNSFRLDEVVD